MVFIVCIYILILTQKYSSKLYQSFSNAQQLLFHYHIPFLRYGNFYTVERNVFPFLDDNGLQLEIYIISMYTKQIFKILINDKVLLSITRLISSNTFCKISIYLNFTLQILNQLKKLLCASTFPIYHDSGSIKLQT